MNKKIWSTGNEKDKLRYQCGMCTAQFRQAFQQKQNIDRDSGLFFFCQECQHASISARVDDFHITTSERRAPRKWGEYKKRKEEARRGHHHLPSNSFPLNGALQIKNHPENVIQFKGELSEEKSIHGVNNTA